MVKAADGSAVVRCAAGEVGGVGRAPLGDRDGRLSLYLADDLWLLHEPGADRPAGDLHDLLRAHLAEKGASFFADLRAAAGGGLERTVLDALWDLVFAGFMALCAYSLGKGTLETITSGETTMMLQIVVWPAIALCALLSGLVALVAVNTAVQLVRGRA